MELSELRETINSIDEQLVELLTRRIDAVSQVAQYKKLSGMPVLDSGREKAIFERLERLARPDVSEDIAEIFALVIRLSRERQERILEGGK